jgi:hypothetical protein
MNFTPCHEEFDLKLADQNKKVQVNKVGGACCMASFGNHAMQNAELRPEMLQ